MAGLTVPDTKLGRESIRRIFHMLLDSIDDFPPDTTRFAVTLEKVGDKITIRHQPERRSKT